MKGFELRLRYILGGVLLAAVSSAMPQTVCAAGNDATFNWFEYTQAVSRSTRGAKTQGVCLVDSFASAEIGPQWTYLNEPELDNYAVTKNGLKLTPTYTNLTSLHFSPTALFLDSIAQPFLAATSLRYTPVTEHDFAGMALYSDASTAIIFGKAVVNGRPAVVVRSRADGRAETAFQPLQKFEWGRPVWLRIKAHNGEVSFFYSTNDGVTWTPVANHLPLPADAILGLYTTINAR